MVIIISLLITIIYAILEKSIDKLLIITISYFIQLKFMEIMLKNLEVKPIMMVNLISNSIVYLVFGISAILEVFIITFFNVSNRIINLFMI